MLDKGLESHQRTAYCVQKEIRKKNQALNAIKLEPIVVRTPKQLFSRK